MVLIGQWLNNSLLKNKSEVKGERNMKFWELVAFLQYGDIPTSYFVKRGMKIGKNFNRQSATRLDPSHCWLISIGDDVSIGNKVQILDKDCTQTLTDT